MLDIEINKIYNAWFERIISSFDEGEFTTKFTNVSIKNIADLTASVQATIGIHNSTDPSKIIFSVNNNVFEFEGDINVVLKVLNQNSFLSDVLYSHLQKNVAMQDFIKMHKTDMQKSGVGSVQEEKVSKAFFERSTSSHNVSDKLKASDIGANIPEPEKQEIEQIKERYSHLSDAAKAVLLDSLNNFPKNKNESTSQSVKVQ